MHVHVHVHVHAHVHVHVHVPHARRPPATGTTGEARSPRGRARRARARGCARQLTEATRCVQPPLPAPCLHPACTLPAPCLHPACTLPTRHLCPLHRCIAAHRAACGVQTAQLAMGRLAIRSEEVELWLRRAASQGYIDAEAARGAHRAVQRPLLQKLRLLAASTGYEIHYVDL